jgi:hypothetical protein
MAEKIKMWQELGPRLAPATALESEEVIEELIAATNQTRGSVLAVLSELDVVISKALKSGRIVKLPNGTTYRPIGKKDGSIKIGLRLNPMVTTEVNSQFRGTWVNANNIGISEADLIDQWNTVHPEDPVTP